MTSQPDHPDRVVFSGIRPSGDKTLGNYSGGFRQYAATQELGDAFFCIVDLHSLTTPYSPTELLESTYSLAAMLLATGVDPARSSVFVQSHVPAHSQAAWLLGSVTAFGELRRMTQFKEKSSEQDVVSSALFTYPVLMAADILLYQTDLVPIGDDQRQHLELARDLAQRFNARFGATLTVPEGVVPMLGARIKNLRDPGRLMSTSAGHPQGVIRLTDPPDVIRDKLISAVTDSEGQIRYDPSTKPGISNLIEILCLASGETVAAVEARYSESSYSVFKRDVSDAVVSLLQPIQRRYAALRSDDDAIREVLADGAARAVERSSPTLEMMADRMGLLRAARDEPMRRALTATPPRAQ